MTGTGCENIKNLFSSYSTRRHQEELAMTIRMQISMLHPGMRDEGKSYILPGLGDAGIRYLIQNK